MEAPRRALLRQVLIPLLAIVALAGTLLAAVGAAGAAGGADWSTYGFDLARTGYNPNETTIGTGNVSGLHQLWSYDLGAVSIAQPAFASGVIVNSQPNDVVYEGSEHGHLVALNAATGGVIWDRDLGSVDTNCSDMPDTIFGVSGTPTIDRATNRLYETGGDGQVYALDLSTGVTAAGWPVAVTTDPTHEHVYAGITLSNGKLYVATASYCDITPYHGHVVEIDIASHSRVASWFVVGRTVNGGGIWGPGGVSLDTATGHVFAATGNALTNPEHYRGAEKVVELSSSLKPLGGNYPGLTGGDVDFGATPILYQAPGCPAQVTAKNKSGVLVTYTRGSLSSGPTQRLQVGNVSDWQFNGIPAWSPVTNTIYIGNSSDSSPYVEGMVALKVQGDCTLSLSWQNGVSDPGPWSSVSPPSVANGVVYYGNGVGNKAWAFDATTGTKLWDSGSTITGPIFAAPTVINGMVFVASWDHKLHAFGL
jgi:outer membrane protein assembly factor BamB